MSHLALRLRGGVEYGFRERIKLYAVIVNPCMLQSFRSTHI